MFVRIFEVFGTVGTLKIVGIVPRCEISISLRLVTTHFYLSKQAHIYKRYPFGNSAPGYLLSVHSPAFASFFAYYNSLPHRTQSVRDN